MLLLALLFLPFALLLALLGMERVEHWLNADAVTVPAADATPAAPPAGDEAPVGSDRAA